MKLFMRMQSLRISAALAAVIGLAGPLVAQADEPIEPPQSDPHYTKVGFFDVHVCNWPGRPLFFLTLFSTERYNDVAAVDIFAPDGRPVGQLDMTRYRIWERKNKPDKHVFMKHLDIPDGHPDGWYSARVTMKDGSVYAARDYVVIHRLDIATGIQPADGAENVPAPKALTWSPIPGAKYYQVFVRDLWNGGDLILKSKLLSKPRLELPPDLVEPGGYYAWRIHARDVNGNALLGDFNHGSLSGEARFSVSSDD